MRTKPAADVGALARDQYGVVARRQLLALGLSSPAVRRRVRSGRLITLYRGVYAVGHAALTREGRALAAQLACGDRAALGLGSSALHMGLLASSSPAWDIVVPEGAARSHAGIRVHRTTDISAEEIVIDGPIRHTSLARTALDLAAAGPARRVRQLLREAEIQRLFDLHELRAVLDRHRGRAGTRALRQILADLDGGPVNEGLEADFLEFVRARGLPPPEVQAPLGPYRADFLWRAQRVAVETNDFASHGIRSSFEHDNQRGAWFAARHIAIVPVTARRLRRDPDGVERDLRGALGSFAQ